MNKAFYQRYVFFFFAATTVLFFALPWEFPFTTSLWFVFITVLIRMRVHAYGLPHVTTFFGKALTKDSSFEERFKSFRFDFYLNIFLLLGLALALCGFDKPNLIALMSSVV